MVSLLEVQYLDSKYFNCLVKTCIDKVEIRKGRNKFYVLISGLVLQRSSLSDQKLLRLGFRRRLWSLCREGSKEADGWKRLRTRACPSTGGLGLVLREVHGYLVKLNVSWFLSL